MVSIIKALLFSSLLIAFTYGQECKNSHWRCDSYHAKQGAAYLKRECGNSRSKVARYCKKLCGLCDGEVKTTTTTTTKTTPTTTTTTTGDCKDETRSCKQWKQYCTTSPFTQKSCRKTCGLCDGGKTTTTTTKKPMTTTKKTTTTTTKRPATTKKITTTTTKKPTTTKKITTTTTKKPVTVNPPAGGCGDKMFYCFLKEMFKPAQHCSGSHADICIRSCGRCNGPDNQKCANLTDRDPQCSQRDCRASNLIERNRAHVKCAKYCCMRGELY